MGDNGDRLASTDGREEGEVLVETSPAPAGCLWQFTLAH